jgi:HTH-type transcriptional regulator / antitoxin MqsA
MKCPVCGAAELIHDTRDLPYTYKGETTTIPAVTADFCPACGESITDMAETDTVDPGFIANVRKKLDLGQREAAQIFGGGVNAFSRYETGKTRPPLALVKLLKVLDRHPELLDEVRVAKWGIPCCVGARFRGHDGDAEINPCSATPPPPR